MSADSETQATLIGEPSGENVSIETSGRLIRPAFEIPAALVDEFRLSATPDGLETKAVDPSNVGLFELSVNAEAFEDYDLAAEDDLQVGINLNRFRKQLRNARKGKRSDDPVTLDIDGTRTLVEAEREYQHTTLTRTGELLNLDPDSVRDKADMPDLELGWQATVDVDAFVDAVEHIDRSSDHAEIREHDGDMVMGGRGAEQTGEFAAVATFENVAEPWHEENAEEGDASIFSMSYLTDMAPAMKKALADEVTIRWDGEFPCFLEFERTVEQDGEEVTAYEALFMLAPRIKGD